MKKITNIILLVLFASSIFAQDVADEQNGTSKKASSYLPTAGDLAIGISLNPFANFIGDMLNGNHIGGSSSQIGGKPYDDFSAFTANAYPTISILGKYMTSDNVGIRANLGVLINSINNTEYVVDDAELAVNPLSRQKVTDYQTVNRYGGSLSLGLETRRGQKRVQGVFSLSALYAFSVTKTKYSYGNAITEINQVPTVSAFSYYTTVTSAFPNARRKEVFTANGCHTAGLVGSVGVELFIAPKVAIGSEVNISALYSWTPGKYVTYEGFNTLSGKVEEFTELVAPRSTEFLFGTKNIGANLYVSFYIGR